MYIEMKNDLRMGKTSTSAGKDANGDNLSPLPGSIGNGPSPIVKDRERLLKRNSGGRPKSRASLASDALESLKK